MPKITVVLLLIVGIVVGCSEEQAPQQSKDELVKSVTVETQELDLQPFEQYLKLVGSVEAQNDVRVSAEVSGRVQKYYVEQGDRVQKGEAMLKIDDSKLQREQARLQAQTQQAREQYQRLKRVFEQDSIGSEIDVINAKSNYEQSKAALESINVDLKNTTVRAPFNATVDKIMMEQGEMASPGAVLLRLIGNNQFKVSAGVPSTYSNAVTKGDMAEIWFDVKQADTLRLPISFVGESIDPQARTFEIEVKLPPQSQHYKVDMICNVKVRTFREDSAIVIGKEYISKNEEDNNVVYTVGQDSAGNHIARMRPVQLGSSYKNDVIISKGLTPGDRLITVGSSFLQDAMRINIVENRERNIAQEN